MIKIKTLTIKNFLSVGAVTQSIDFDRQDLTLILGENLDLGGDGARNGTGKTTMLQAVAYALFGEPLNNIRRDNLVNRTNGKNMVVTLDFEVADTAYRITRGRKPNVLKFYVNDQEQDISDEAQGDSRETQAAIEHLLKMTPEMFRHIVVLNTYTEPFLALKANDQRVIIEQLLGITILSEKAEAIKALNKSTRDSIQSEQARIQGVQEANRRITEQIQALERRQSLWQARQQQDLAEWQQELTELTKLDITAELAAHKALAEHNQTAQIKKDFDAARARLVTDLQRSQREKLKHEQAVAALRDHRCHSCGQTLHDDQHGLQLAEKTAALVEVTDSIAADQACLAELDEQIADLGPMGALPKTFYDRESEAVVHHSKIENLRVKIAERGSDTDPYAEQIAEMRTAALAEIDFSEINSLTRRLQHQEYLLDLLTNKKSFVRKRIIEQNLNYLNARLTHYLDRMGLPHQVVFQNDLTVEITEFGREMDFFNLSRGEMTRLILSLSWAFRDVWESLYTPINVMFIDEIIDNGIDAIGTEKALAALKHMARERNKSLWLISHKEDLATRVDNILKVTKENGFTSFGTDVEV